MPTAPGSAMLQVESVKLPCSEVSTWAKHCDEAWVSAGAAQDTNSSAFSILKLPVPASTHATHVVLILVGPHGMLGL